MLSPWQRFILAHIHFGGGGGCSLFHIDDPVGHLSRGHRRQDLAVLVPPSRCAKALEDNPPVNMLRLHANVYSVKSRLTKKNILYALMCMPFTPSTQKAPLMMIGVSSPAPPCGGMKPKHSKRRSEAGIFVEGAFPCWVP